MRILAVSVFRYRFLSIGLILRSDLASISKSQYKLTSFCFQCDEIQAKQQQRHSKLVNQSLSSHSHHRPKFEYTTKQIIVYNLAHTRQNSHTFHRIPIHNKFLFPILLLLLLFVSKIIYIFFPSALAPFEPILAAVIVPHTRHFALSPSLFWSEDFDWNRFVFSFIFVAFCLLTARTYIIWYFCVCCCCLLESSMGNPNMQGIKSQNHRAFEIARTNLILL